MIGGKPDAITNIYKRTIFLFVNNVSPYPDCKSSHRHLIGAISGRGTARFF